MFLNTCKETFCFWRFLLCRKINKSQYSQSIKSKIKLQKSSGWFWSITIFRNVMNWKEFSSTNIRFLFEGWNNEWSWKCSNDNFNFFFQKRYLRKKKLSSKKNISVLKRIWTFQCSFSLFEKKKKWQLLLLIPKIAQTKSQTTSMFMAEIHWSWTMTLTKSPSPTNRSMRKATVRNLSVFASTMRERIRTWCSALLRWKHKEVPKYAHCCA